MKLIAQTQIVYEIEQLQIEVEDVIRREMVRHPIEQIDAMVDQLKPAIKRISQVNDPMSHDKWDVVCVLDGNDRAIFIWDNDSLDKGTQALRHDIFGRLSKLARNFYT